jgi:hypothetical protein
MHLDDDARDGQITVEVRSFDAGDATLAVIGLDGVRCCNERGFIQAHRRSPSRGPQHSVASALQRSGTRRRCRRGIRISGRRAPGSLLPRESFVASDLGATQVFCRAQSAFHQARASLGLLAARGQSRNLVLAESLASGLRDLTQDSQMLTAHWTPHPFISAVDPSGVRPANDTRGRVS